MVNLYLGSDPGYKLGIVHSLIEQKIIDYCLADYVPVSTITPPQEDPRIETTSVGMAINRAYADFCDINALPALDQELLEAMEPFESTAISFGIRRTNYPMTLYEDEKRNYLLHLRYWNYILEDRKINVVFFDNIPHTQHKYVIYALAKIKHIPMLMCYATDFRTLRVFGTDIGRVGEEIGAYFRKLKQSNLTAEECILEGEIKDYYELHTLPMDELKKKMNPGSDGFTAKKRKETAQFLHGPYLSLMVSLRPYYVWVRNLGKSLLLYHGLKYYRETEKYRAEETKNVVLSRLYQKRLSDGQTDYNRYAQKADLSQNYILFCMHLTPEASTLPAAGVFTPQYNAIQLLAKIAEKFGVLVYVKEHYVQPTRSKAFYRDLKEINNVRLIKTTESTYDLMEKCLAVSTLTGTCIQEGILMGKPAMVIGNGYFFKGMPGLFEIRSQQDGEDALKEIMDGYVIDRNEVKKYFYAIQKTSVPYNFVKKFNKWGDGALSFDPEESDKTKQAIVGMIKELCVKNGLRSDIAG